MRVVVAPDSLKGTIAAADAAAAVAAGWAAVRPGDTLVLVPLADGGEGTLEVLAAARPGATRVPAGVTGPDGGPWRAVWLLLPDGTAVVESALACGLPLTTRSDPLGATSRGLGDLLLAATAHPGVRRVVVGLGGSATTDGGTGALSALGARFRPSSGGRPLPPGGGALADLGGIDLSTLVPPPPGGCRCLVDVTAPLLGPLGAAAQFGPQKGAGPDQVAVLERGLARLAEMLGGDPAAPGAGAAGGTAYGLATAWGATLVPGAAEVAVAAGLPAALRTADLVITGEGRFDEQSLRGKVVSEVLTLAGRAGVPVVLVAGRLAAPIPRGVRRAVDLAVLAGGEDAARAEPARWLRAAGRHAAEALTL